MLIQMDSLDVIPVYPYRDDGLLIYNSIRIYVSRILKNYYGGWMKNHVLNWLLVFLFSLHLFVVSFLVFFCSYSSCVISSHFILNYVLARIFYSFLLILLLLFLFYLLRLLLPSFSAITFLLCII